MNRSPPVQVWVPQLGFNPFESGDLRDIHRAQIQWHHEDRAWLLPDLKEPFRWVEQHGGFRLAQLAIPAEAFNVIDIINIARDGHTYPPLLQEQGLPAALPAGLYRLWLNTEPAMHRSVGQFSLLVPVNHEGTVSYEEATVELGQGAVLPITEIDSRERTLTTQWPPPGSTAPRPAISPETEKLAAQQLDMEQVLKVNLVWPAPFDRMFPLGGDADLLHQWAVMKRLAAQAQTPDGRKNALLETDAWLRGLIAEGVSTVERSFLGPARARGEDAALIDFEGRFGMQAATLEELASKPGFREIADREVPVVRLLGWLAYLWWEFHWDLQSFVTMRVCQHCGDVIRGGHRDRSFCSSDENPTCFRTRTVHRQRKSRSKTS
jgi:hypothetical protein